MSRKYHSNLISLQIRHIVKELEYSNIGATELILSNGMRICYKRTDFLNDQVSILVGIACQVYHSSYTFLKQTLNNCTNLVAVLIDNLF